MEAKGTATSRKTESVGLLSRWTDVSEAREDTGVSDAAVKTCQGFFGDYRPSAVYLARATMIFSLVALLIGAMTVPALLSTTKSSDFEAPTNSPSREGFRQLSEKFPLFAKGAASPIVLLVRTKEGSRTALADGVAKWSQRFLADSKTDQRSSEFAPVVMGYFLGASVLRVEAKDELLRSLYVSHDRRATVVAFMPTKFPHGFASDVLNATWKEHTTGLMDFFKEHMSDPPEGCEVLLTGNPVMVYERESDHSIEALLRAEIIILPIALAVLAALVREVRLLVIPPVVLTVSFAFAATLVWPVGFFVPVSPDIPPAMLSLSVALCLDYSLFLLTRFNENRLHGRSTIQENVDIVVRTTGHTIMVSGLLIAISFFGALTLPSSNLRSAGLCLGITTLACMGVSFMLGPAMLLLFGSVLAPSKSDDSSQRMMHCPRPGLTYTNIQNSAGTACRAPWVRLMRSVSMYPLAWVLAACVAFAPLLMCLPAMKSSADSYAVMPGEMPSVVALRELGHHLPPGRFDPYSIVVTQDAGGSKHETGVTAYNTLLELCDMIQDLGGVASLMAPMWLLDQRMDWGSHQRLLHSPVSRDRNMYRSLLNSLVNGSSILIQVQTSFSPRGPGSATWVEETRQALDMWASVHPGYHAWLSGGASLAADSRDTLMTAMPVYLGISVAAIMAVVFGLFQSVFLPIRLAFAILFSLGVSFGAAVVVYQTPLLHGLFPWLADYSGITYEVIPLAAGVSVALGLDYDIFLITRIVEYRESGLPDEVSIVKGVTNTGSIISGAGIIMALAFSGLFFSSKLLHKQFALLLVVSVLLDTFVVRTVLVPALMLNARGMNWWPRKMPECAASMRTSEMVEEDEEAAEEACVYEEV